MKKHQNWKQQRHTEAKQRKALKRRREMKRRASGKLTPPSSHKAGRFGLHDLRAMRQSMPALTFLAWMESQGRRAA